MSDPVVIFDTTLRDGEQSAGVAFTLADKIEIARALAVMRVDVVEVGFPAASPVEVEAVAAISREVRDVRIAALARAVESDVDAAGEALAGAASPRIHVFLSASDVHMRHQLHKDREQVLRMTEAMVRRARRYTDDVEFSPMDATRADLGFVAEVVRAALGAGATTINVPDTVGWILPGQLAERITALRRAVPEIEAAVISFHGHDDLGLATANALAAVGAGVRQLEVTVNGIGERAGNTPLEEVVMAIHVHGEALGVHTGVDTRAIHPLSRRVAERSGLVVAANKAVVGRNAFRHASGIHQDGVVKFRETFEVLDPASVGHDRGSEIVLGKLSGRAGFRVRTEALGVVLDEASFDRAFRRFQEVADRTREVGDEELLRIVGREGPVPSAA